MDIINLEYNGNACTELLSHLKNQVFHLTAAKSYGQIIKSGCIANNKDGQFGINPSSERSYGRLNGYICFFDLRAKDEDFVQGALNNYNFLGPTWFTTYGKRIIKTNIAYFVLHRNYYNQLIQWEKAIEDYNAAGKPYGKYPYGVPRAEAWIENKVPLDWISKVLLVKLRTTVLKKEIHAAALY